jgi:methyl-accepting chemotaxis protein
MSATAAIVLIVVVLEDPLLEYQVRRRMLDDLLAAGEAAASAIEGGEDADAAADRLGAQHECRIVIFDADGAPVGDTAGVPSAAASSLRRFANGLASDGSPAVAPLGPTESGDLAAAIQGPAGVAIVATRSRASLDAARDNVRGLLFIAGLLAGAIGLLLTWILARAIVRPLRAVTDATEALARGDLSVRIRSPRRDEIGELGRAIDRMAEDLTDRMARLRTQEERLRKVLDAMVEAVFVTDSQGQIVLSNRALAALARGAPEGRTVMEVLRSPELHQAVQAAAKEGTRQVEFDVRVGADIMRRMGYMSGVFFGVVSDWIGEVILADAILWLWQRLRCGC